MEGLQRVGAAATGQCKEHRASPLKAHERRAELIMLDVWSGAGVSQAEALKEENDSLRCQLDAYRNEVELLKQEQGKNQPISEGCAGTSRKKSSCLQQLFVFSEELLENHLVRFTLQLLKMREELKQREAEVEKSLEDKQQLNDQVQNLKEGLQNLQNTQAMQVGYERLETTTQDDSEEAANQTAEATVSTVVSCSQEKEVPPEKTPLSPVHSEREALLVGIISTFLHVHPFGASIEYICSYLQRLDTKLTELQLFSGEMIQLITLYPWSHELVKYSRLQLGKQTLQTVALLLLSQEKL
ncbi:Ecto-NOX disulfide-thiol exchanger 2 [Liparis tanakae]|uniref:Ecto-NOX disulfide-thiol exchanger 2 n=1 Tax=Liparis tanakae TaxID=230148 RepID=A0A4Z2HZX5_9TELE|nr:Ecto-NOX disulfide-thiol exchanger 2 [Liparis tanakae]